LTRFTSRDGTESQRGFILISVLILAILYFALMELMLMQTAESFRQAERFRSRIVAQVLAENGAELAGQQMVNQFYSLKTYEDNQGKIRGEYKQSPGGQFELTGTGQTSGLASTQASVHIQGQVVGTSIHVDFTTHSQ
jgi:Tfp pilus assembly protein PilX